MVRRQLRARRTSPKTPATFLKRGTCREHLTGCLASTSRSDLSLTTARRTYLISPGLEVSPRHPAQRPPSLRIFVARRERLCRVSPQTSRKLRTESICPYSSNSEVSGEYHLERVGTKGTRMSYSQRKNGNGRNQA